MLKDLIKALLVPAVAFLFSLFIARFPDFPLDSKQVLAVILWVVGLLYSGAKLKSFKQKRNDLKRWKT